MLKKQRRDSTISTVMVTTMVTRSVKINGGCEEPVKTTNPMVDVVGEVSHEPAVREVG